MYDFFKITYSRKNYGKTVVIKPEFSIGSSKDLMIRGKDFYAIWDEVNHIWVRDELKVVDIVDTALRETYENWPNKEENIEVLYMKNSSSGTIDAWHKYVQKQLRDNYHELDSKITFLNTKIEKEDYITRRLPYALEQGNIDAYNELMDTLYSPQERDKLEWAIGAIISGDAKRLHKFIVLYGEPGSGKSTFLNIVQKMFDGYYCVFNAKGLTSINNQFGFDSFKNNPLIAIQHDGDLSRIEDNTKLNSLVSHEEMEVNIKYGGMFTQKFNAFLFMGTNKPVKITEGKSGILRRLIDVNPTGNKVPTRRYNQLIKQIDFELGAIAYHCLQKYEDMGINYYDTYIPTQMIVATNDFYDFLDYYYEEFASSDYILLKDAWGLYKSYCELANVPYPMSMRGVCNELKNYFDEFIDELKADGKHYRKVYRGFKKEKFKNKFTPEKDKEEKAGWLQFMELPFNVFNIAYAECPAQIATPDDKPYKKWTEVLTELKDIDTSMVHYVRVPENHIVIDFDLKDETGKKSFERNLEAANKWPPTYAELSKSGAGIHLHYIYDGDPNMLSRIYDDDIEIKVFTGKSSLRRKLSLCNDISIAHINSGLPLKEEKSMVDFTTVKNEKALRTIIKKNLNKEYHGATKPSVDFIYKVLEDAHASGMKYDVSDMKQAILYFASQSTHQADKCLELVSKMKFSSVDEIVGIAPDDYDSSPIIFYDVEIFPNLFLLNWMYDDNDEVVRMINPTPGEIEKLTHYRLIGFNNRRYDNHILYARMMGYNNMQLYHLSQRLVNPDKNVNKGAMFANAYNLSYADIYDFMSEKKSLKKWEISLGIHHKELGLPWDEPVPEEKWDLVAEYCDNDVIATKALFHSEQCQGDFIAREIISELSGLPINNTTNNHSTKFIFGDNKKPQDQFVYTDLSTIFPGYTFDFKEVESVTGKKTRKKVSSYLDVEDVGEGGYVYSEPGMYDNVWVFDVSSMHPSSIKALNLFGDIYTKRFWDLVEARLAIKHGDFDKVRKMFDGKLEPYLKDEKTAKQLSQALKIVINSVYGLTSATFDNPFRDPRNVDNIVAKRGALFMINLRHELQKMGVQVIHIKTDSIKISNPTEKVKKFIVDYGKKYGYNFEIENIYKKFCLVNDAVYIAKKDDDKWDATGAQFAVPYVFKTLFSKEPIIFEDLCETKSVTTAIYLDMNEKNEEEHNYVFVGKVGLFCPILPGYDGGLLMAERTDPKTGEKKYSAVTGTKGYRWLESEMVREKELQDYIDKSYYIHLVDEAVETISKYGDFESFID